MNIYFVNTISLFTGGKHPFPRALAAAADAAVRPSDLCRNQLKLRFGKILFPKEDEYKETCCPAEPPTYIYAAYRSFRSYISVIITFVLEASAHSAVHLGGGRDLSPALLKYVDAPNNFARVFFPKEDDYKEICCPKAVQIYVGGPAGPPTYVYAAFRSHISL